MPDSQPGPSSGHLLIGRHEVLITRSGEAATRTAEQVRQLGLTPVLAPLFSVRPRAFRWPGGLAAVLVTSGNAVPSLTGMPAVPLLAVGDGTAQQARAAGLHQVHSAAGDAVALLALARRMLRPGASVLLATGAGQGTTLAAGLRAAGFRVHRRTAYVVRPVSLLPEAAVATIKGGQLHAALFLSAETARIFMRLLPLALRPALAGVQAIVIATPVADALAPLPWRRVRVSVAPTLDQVLALL